MPDLKAITLWQPWATLIADGYKRVETRSWPTNHRGFIAIHAARKPAAEGIDAVTDNLTRLDGTQVMPILRRLYDEPLALGAVVAVGNVTGCYRMDGEAIRETSPLERALGDHRPDRYGWVISDVQPIQPIPCVGAQGLWNLPDDVVVEIQRMGVEV